MITKSPMIGVVSALGLLAACTPANNVEHVYQSITAERLRPHLITLASDEFAGRLPTTEGERKTIAYLQEQLAAVGLQPGNGDSFLQPVNLIEITADPNMQLHIGEHAFDYKTDMVAASKREQPLISLQDSPVVFVGYGVNAPEYQWNDYEGIDVKGKTVVMLINDPGFENPTGDKFQGTAMTYYGRWSYKFEEASRQGAAAAFIIHETAPASYGWSVVANSWSGAQYGLVSEDGGASRVAVEGWLSLEAAEKVFTAAGMDFTTEKANAIQGPYHRALDTTASIDIRNQFQTSVSNNVIATLPGRQVPEEHIIYTAHWDHLGTDESREGDQIYNGAHDNATGTAAALVLARAFAELTPRPARSVTFLLVTAEEQGLLGSKFYAANPIIPHRQTVANINMDALNILGRTKDVAVVGKGKSSLEQHLAQAAQRQGRVVTAEERPEAGSYYRSDHFSFANVGVPALYASGGSEPIDEATAEYRKRMKVIATGCYHQVCDQYRDSWDLGGMVEDMQLFFDVGLQLADSDVWPTWSAQSEFQRPE